jgi:hypothetical protein
MQDNFSCLPSVAHSVSATLAPARIGRYMPAAGGNASFALRLYVWNARLCEAMYLPLQLAEVASRNAISIPLMKRFGSLWYEDHRFENLLTSQFRMTLQDTVSKEKRRRTAPLTVDHVIAALPFGFWVNLMARPFENQLWATGVKVAFPNAAKLDSRQSIHARLERMRKIRNDIMHHYAIFDKGPQAEATNILELISFICTETAWLAQQVSTISRVINDRPKT